MPKTVVNVTYSTITQAETEVFRLIESKTNYRDICQIEFVINGVTKKFSLSQISKIKQKLSPKDNSNSLETKTDSEQKAELFELFQNKESVVDVIIKTKLDSKLVNEAFEDYTKLNGDVAVSEKSLDDVLEILYKCDEDYGCINYDFETPFNILRACKDYLAQFRELLQQFQYPCDVCKELIPLSEKSWDGTAKPALSKSGWGHERCHT